jgi:energy-converting hydrogenase A subunit M
MVGIYIDMNNSIRSIIRKYITEERVNWIKEHCNNSFSEKSERMFCYAATKVLKDNYGLQQDLHKSLKKFVEINKDTINQIRMETLSKESKIAIDGLEELRWVNENGKELCPNIKSNIVEIYNNLMNGVYVFYADPKTGEYHAINRLDTNYSALAVMITEYFRDLGAINTLQNRNIRFEKEWEKVAEYLVKFVNYPNIYHPSNSDIDAIRKIEVDQKPLKYIFEKLLNNLDSKISKKTNQILANVREAGFVTERKFIKQLEKYGITYQNFGKDYGFVDRFLGIDLFIKLNDGWYPTQVKSSEREKTLISGLGCEGSIIVYPDDKGDFWVGNISFERFFCKMNKVCTKNPKGTEE